MQVHVIPYAPILCLRNSPIASGKVTLERDKQQPSWGLLWVRHGRSSIGDPSTRIWGYQSNAITYHGSDLGLFENRTLNRIYGILLAYPSFGQITRLLPDQPRIWAVVVPRNFRTGKVLPGRSEFWRQHALHESVLKCTTGCDSPLFFRLGVPSCHDLL